MKTADKTCVVSTVTNCKTLPDDKAGECTTCKTGFVLKKDKLKCDALPAGCAAAYYDATVQCTTCDIAGSYYATDVKGTATFNDGAKDQWEQVCTKSAAAGGAGGAGSTSQIVAVSVMILAMISNF